MNENKWSYLAGLFDGEGSVYIFLRDKENHFTTLSAAISNTSLPLMRWLITNFGGRFSTAASKAQSGHKTQYKWEPKGKTNKKELLLGMLPYLVIKREQAILGLKYLDIEGPNVEAKEQLRQKMVSLNKGSVETNTQDTDETVMIESELHGDMQSAPDVNQGSDKCEIPPKGWWCSRKAGHDGPCAARPTSDLA